MNFSLSSGNFVWLSFPMYFAVNFSRFTAVDVKSPMHPKKKTGKTEFSYLILFFPNSRKMVIVL